MIAVLRLAACVWAVAWAGVPSVLAASSDGTLEPPALFATEALAGWEWLSTGEAVPYQSENLSSELLYAARSPNGSYAFVTRTDNTLSRPAPEAAKLQSFFSREAFSDLSPEGFTTHVAAVHVAAARGPAGTPLDALVCDFTTRSLPYTVGREADGASTASAVRFKAILLPVVLWDETTERYSNHLYAADFRGRLDAAADLAAFDALWQEISLPESGWSVVPSHRFNAIQPELAEGPDRVRSDPPKPDPARPLPPLGEAPTRPSDADGLAAVIHRLASGEVSGLPPDRPDSLDGTVLGAVMDRLQRDALHELERQVWNRAFGQAAEDLRGRLLALFLAESLARGDRDLAGHIAQDALDSFGTLGGLDCASWRIVLDGVMRNREALTWRDPELEAFLRWRGEAVCRDLPGLLTDLGLPLPEPERAPPDADHTLRELLDGP